MFVIVLMKKVLDGISPRNKLCFLKYYSCYGTSNKMYRYSIVIRYNSKMNTFKKYILSLFSTIWTVGAKSKSPGTSGPLKYVGILGACLWMPRALCVGKLGVTQWINWQNVVMYVCTRGPTHISLHGRGGCCERNGEGNHSVPNPVSINHLQHTTNPRTLRHDWFYSRPDQISQKMLRVIWGFYSWLYPPFLPEPSMKG